MRDVRVVVDAEADDEDDGDARDGVDGQAPEAAGWQFNGIENSPKNSPNSQTVQTASRELHCSASTQYIILYREGRQVSDWVGLA